MHHWLFSSDKNVVVGSGSHAHAHGREAVPLSGVRQTVQPTAQLQVPPECARGHARVRGDLPRVRQVLQRPRLPQLPHEDPPEPQGN